MSFDPMSYAMGAKSGGGGGMMIARYTCGLTQEGEPDFGAVTCDRTQGEVQGEIDAGRPVAAVVGFLHPALERFVVLGIAVGGSKDPEDPLGDAVIFSLPAGSAIYYLVHLSEEGSDSVLVRYVPFGGALGTGLGSAPGEGV